jgi:hypothetical protein
MGYHFERGCAECRVFLADALLSIVPLTVITRGGLEKE